LALRQFVIAALSSIQRLITPPVQQHTQQRSPSILSLDARSFFTTCTLLGRAHIIFPTARWQLQGHNSPRSAPTHSADLYTSVIFQYQTQDLVTLFRSLMGRPSTKCSYLFDLHFLSTGQVALTQYLSRISWILLLQCTFRASTQLGPHSSSFHRTATQDSPWGTYHTEISMPSASLYWSHKPMTISLFHITDQRLSDIFIFWLPLHLSFGTNHALALYLIAVAVLIYCHHIRLHDLANTITLDLSFLTKPAATFQDSIFSFIPPLLDIIHSHCFEHAHPIISRRIVMDPSHLQQNAHITFIPSAPSTALSGVKQHTGPLICQLPHIRLLYQSHVQARFHSIS